MIVTHRGRWPYKPSVQQCLHHRLNEKVTGDCAINLQQSKIAMNKKSTHASPPSAKNTQGRILGAGDALTVNGKMSRAQDIGPKSSVHVMCLFHCTLMYIEGASVPWKNTVLVYLRAQKWEKYSPRACTQEMREPSTIESRLRKSAR